MTTAQFKKKYEDLQKEAKAIATELKPLAKRYKALCTKATTLGTKVDYDARLYKENKELGDHEPDGWNIHVLFRLTDFEDEAGFLLRDAYLLLMNLVDQPFNKQLKWRKH